MSVNADAVIATPVDVRYLEAAIPLLSFGMTGAGILLWQTGYQIEFQYFAIGCFISSCILAYLALLRPKKDIVGLTTPIYAAIIIFSPTEYYAGVVLQLVYSLSLTILLMRLKYRFGTPGTAATLGKELGGSLKIYIEKTRSSFGNVSPKAAHAAAVVFVRFAEGNYGDAEQSSKNALIEEETFGQSTTLRRAFSIIQEHSMLLNMSLPRPVTHQIFTESDFPLLTKPAVHENDAELEFDTALDNALLVVFSAAWNNSEQDRTYLLAYQAFAQRLMMH
jgi:hypothetical protein